MLTMASGALLATAGPSEDRVRLVDFFAERFAGVPLDDYVYGALIANQRARAIRQIMGYAFLGDIDGAENLGRRFAAAKLADLPDGGRNVAGNYLFHAKLGKVLPSRMYQRLPARQPRVKFAM
jgi:hypothetical protein